MHHKNSVLSAGGQVLQVAQQVQGGGTVLQVPTSGSQQVIMVSTELLHKYKENDLRNSEYKAALDCHFFMMMSSQLKF